MNERKKRDSFLFCFFLAVIFLKGENKAFHVFLLVILGEVVRGTMLRAGAESHCRPMASSV